MQYLCIKANKKILFTEPLVYLPYYKKWLTVTLEILLVLTLFYLTGAITNLFNGELTKKGMLLCCASMVLLPMVLYFSCFAINAYYPTFAEKVLLTEDGIIESATLAMYLWTAANLLLVKRKKLFDYAIIVMCIFVAGEEMSWGQRILGFETSDWWKTLNPQDETTFHNLVLGGLVVWGLMIFPGVIYLLFGKYLINKFAIIQKLTHWVGIPTPRYFYGVVLAAIILLNLTIELSDNNEVMEVCLSMLVVWFVNIELAPGSRTKYFFTPTAKASGTFTV